VASLFRHGVNVLFSESSDPAFLSIQTPDVPLHPWAVRACSLPALPENEPVIAEAKRIRFPDADAIIDLSQAAVDELEIGSYAPEGAACAVSRTPILEQVLAEEPSERIADPFQAQIGGILAAWRTTGEARVLPALTGLGSGSTPAGDDVLVGLLAGWTALEETDSEARRSLTTLRSVLSGMALGHRTHLASAQMIAAALDGSFPEPLRDLVAGLGDVTASDTEIREFAQRLSALGTTSGWMMLRGLAAAMR